VHPRTGDRFGRYTIESLLGEGGMGRVYRARDSKLQRTVALKLLRLDAYDVSEASDVQARGSARLLREARAAAALDHISAIAIHDVGEEDGVPFIAMEFVDGSSLRPYVGDATVPIETRVAWLADVARVLAAAHDRGLIHRDIKPENVMVRRDGLVKVLDFGIARSHRPLSREPLSAREPAAEAGPEGYARTWQNAGTSSFDGGLVGTPRYMAPEQLRGEPLDPRTDQFAWGVLAFELLTGNPLWAGQPSSLTLVAAITSDDPAPLQSLSAVCPPHIAAVVARALSKNREGRFPSMLDVVAGLEARPLRRAIGRRLLLPLAGGAVALAAAGAGYRLHSRAARMDVDAPRAVAAFRECQENSDCVRAHAGAAFVCRKDDGRCVALETEQCKAMAEPGDVADAGTLWVGVVLPMTGEKGELGRKLVNAADLARRDFLQIAHGIPSASSEGPPRPLAILACDDTKGEPLVVARHLVDDVGSPVVIGFGSTQEAIDLAKSVFIPKRTRADPTSPCRAQGEWRPRRGLGRRFCRSGERRAIFSPRFAATA
jgi:serine/threonine-protein kinase